MAVPHITSFFWCMGLKTGSKCVGIVHLLLSLCLMILCAVFAEHARANIGTVEDADSLYSTWYCVAVVVAVVSVVHVLLAATLLYAIYKDNTMCLRVWVWAMSGLYLIALVYVLGVSAAYGYSDSGSDIFLSFLEGVLFFGVVAYCILCVYSYYLMLKSSQDMEGPHKDNC